MEPPGTPAALSNTKRMRNRSGFTPNVQTQTTTHTGDDAIVLAPV